MKIRTVIVNFEIETALPVENIKTWIREHFLEVRQIQLNVIDKTKPAKRKGRR